MGRPTRVQLGHGAGGLMSRRLIDELFVAHLCPRAAEAPLDDAAPVPTGGGAPLRMTTDAFVVDPMEFPGGNIGELAVCGTVNDLWVCGARPAALSVAYILEEGLELSVLERVVRAMAAAAEVAGVRIATGDTKVVPRGSADGCYITTAGVGELLPGVSMGPDRARPGDRLLVSGPIGQHGAAIMACRAGLSSSGALESDCAPLTPIAEALLAAPDGLRAMRDPTRGGLAAALCELAEASGVDFVLQEAAIPATEPARAACELLGLDPLHLACEGRVLVVAAEDVAEDSLQRMRAVPLGAGAVQIGVAAQGPGKVWLDNDMGGRRLLMQPEAEPLPRIC